MGGNDPAPPPQIFRMFRRLEAAAAKLREDYGWPVLCSKLGMAAVYDGKSSRYSQHRDNEWQRHLRPRSTRARGTRKAGNGNDKNKDSDLEGAWMNFRELTM